MCNPHTTGSTLLLPDTRSVRALMREHCPTAATVRAAELIPEAARHDGFTSQEVYPGVYLLTAADEEPTEFMFTRMWALFLKIAPYLLEVGSDGQSPALSWAYSCGSEGPFTWTVKDGHGASLDTTAEGIQPPPPHVYTYRVQSVETWEETMEVTGERARAWFEDPSAPTEDEINDARARIGNLKHRYEFVESEQCTGSIAVDEE